MMKSLWIASTGMETQQLKMDIVSNNMANINTTGFKKSRADFQDLLYQTLRSPGATSATGNQIPTGIQIGHGVRTAAVQKIFQMGDMKQTNNPMDLAVEGDGFFQIIMPNGEIGYSRSGAFKLDSEGRLVNSDGYYLEPEISIPSETELITVGTDGTVSVTIANETSSEEVGQIQLARFNNPSGLRSVGRNLYRPTDSSGDPEVMTPGENGLGTIAQGYLEMSNVNLVEEMVNMIITQRAYEFNSKVIQASDDMLQMASNAT